MPRRLARGEPKDVPSRCNARLHLGDNFGDNHTTCLCGHPAGHMGRHEELSDPGGHRVVITWDGSDEPEYNDCPCDCGFEGTEDLGSLCECRHKFVDGECSECGITKVEHDRIAEERRRDE